MKPASGRTARQGAGRGFSLLELMVVVSVMGLLLGVALPKMNRLLNVMQMDRAAVQLAGELRRARSEAVKRSRAVTFTFIDPGTYQASASTELFRGRLPDGIKGSQGVTVTFRPFGPPISPATFSLSSSSPPNTRTVLVENGGNVRTP